MKYCDYCMNQVQEDAALCPFCGRNTTAEIPPHRLAAGTLLNRKYLVGAAIGEGGFGITYIGRDTTLDLRVAIKEFYPGGYVSRGGDSTVICTATGEREAEFRRSRARFLQEARMLAKCSGEPGIVDVRDFFEENNTAYIVMSYIEGETLKSYLDRNGKIPFATLMEMLMPVMRSLERVHQAGLIHRDISPQNIMLGKNGAKLVDFGAARNVSGAENRSFSVVLKHGYAPEEQYRSKGEQGAWTDVYALSATIYHCITGVLPDDAGQRVFRDELRPPSAHGIAITPAQEAALMKGLGITKNDRFQSVAELCAALTGETFSAPQPASVQVPVPAAAPAEADADLTHYVSQSAPQEPVFAAQPEQTVYRAPEPARVPEAPEAPIAPAAPVTPAAPAAPAPAAKNAAEAPAAEQKPEKKKKTKHKKRKLSREAILAIAAVAVLAVGGGCYAWNNRSLEYTTDYGYSNTINKDDSAAFIASQNIDTSMIAYLNSMPNLHMVTFTKCTFEDAALEELQKMTKITHLTINESSIQEKVLAHIPPSVTSLSMRGNELTNEMLRSVPFEKLTSLRELNLSVCHNLTDLSAAAPAKDVLQYVIVASTGVQDFSPLAGSASITYLSADKCGLDDTLTIDLPALEELHVEENELTALSFAAECPNLKKIWAADNQIASIEELAGKNMELVYLSNNQISDLSPLAASSKLSSLDCCNNQIKDISVLAGKERLSYVKLNNNQITDISAFSGNTYLANLFISDNQIKTLAPLGGNQELRTLEVQRNQLTSLEGLETAIRLKHLYCSENQISDLSPLSNCTLLQTVVLDNNAVSDLSVLAKSKAELTTISFNQNKVSDLSPLQGTGKLAYLSFDDNQVSSLKPLADSPELRLLSAERNALTSLEGLENLQKLEGIYLPNNQITDISALETIDKDSGAVPSLINLSSNQITSLTLPARGSYKALSIFNNPFTDGSALGELIGGTIQISYIEGFDYSVIGGKFAEYEIADCPLDHQIEVQNAIGDRFGFHLKFKTAAEMEQSNIETKAKVYGLDKDEDGDGEADADGDGEADADDNSAADDSDDASAE